MCIHQHFSFYKLFRAEVSDFFYKGPDSKYFRLFCHSISITSTQPCCCSTKVAMDGIYTNELHRLSIKLYSSQRTVVTHFQLDSLGFIDLLQEGRARTMGNTINGCTKRFTQDWGLDDLGDGSKKWAFAVHCTQWRRWCYSVMGTLIPLNLKARTQCRVETDQERSSSHSC